MNSFLIRVAALSLQKALFVGLGLTAFWYFSMFDDGQSLQNRIDKTAADIKIEKNKEKDADAALKEITMVKASLGSLADQFKIVSAQLPTDIQMSEIIRTVDKVSKATGLNVKTKEPKNSIKQDLVEVLPLSVSAEGSYSEVTSFFYYLSSLERIVRVKGFKMTAPTDIRKSKKLQLAAEVVSYKFVPTPEEQKK